jgi:acetoin utilization protein AcuB
MNLLAPVQTIMSKDLITIHVDDTLKTVEDLFLKHKIHHLPVVEANHLIGIVSKSDYLFFKRGFNDRKEDNRVDLLRLKTHKVSEIMTRGVATLEPDQKINVALEIFKENIFHAIPIIEDDRLVGMLTTYDIIKNLAVDKGAVNQYE